MKLKEIFDHLAMGELSQLAMGGGSQGAIPLQYYPKVLSSVQMGLGALYKRFPLRRKTLVIQLQVGRSKYPITTRYSQSRVGTTEGFIVDLDEAYNDDLLKIEEVRMADGTEVPFNDPSDPWSVTTTALNTLYVPAAYTVFPADFPLTWRSGMLEVVYRANHPKLAYDSPADIDPEDMEVELPEAFLEALVAFVGSRVYTPVGMTNEANMGAVYNAKYDAAVRALEDSGIYVDLQGRDDSIVKGGWV